MKMSIALNIIVEKDAIVKDILPLLRKIVSSKAAPRPGKQPCCISQPKFF